MTSGLGQDPYVSKINLILYRKVKGKITCGKDPYKGLLSGMDSLYQTSIAQTKRTLLRRVYTYQDSKTDNFTIF
jgi:hypothetical protein